MNADMNEIESLFGRCRFRGKRREMPRPEAGQAGPSESFNIPKVRSFRVNRHLYHVKFRKTIFTCSSHSSKSTIKVNSMYPVLNGPRRPPTSDAIDLVVSKQARIPLDKDLVVVSWWF
jgi:hypothetical protein